MCSGKLIPVHPLSTVSGKISGQLLFPVMTVLSPTVSPLNRPTGALPYKTVRKQQPSSLAELSAKCSLPTAP
jgi:hypothetical protein